MAPLFTGLKLGFGAGPSGPSGPSPFSATGGVISDYTSGPAIYRAHIFTSSGTFTVSALSTDPSLPNSVEYLVVAGGGGGGSSYGGGGGAGGFRTNLSGHPLAGSSFRYQLHLEYIQFLLVLAVLVDLVELVDSMALRQFLDQ